MQSRIPYFSYDPPKISTGEAACIRVDGRIIHRINDLDGFYKELGYTAELNKAGLMPAEFIWNEYVLGNPPPYAACLQMHIVEYLEKNSVTFLIKYGGQYHDWFDDHVKAVTESNVSCVSCRMKSFCKIGMSGPRLPAHLSAWLGSIPKDNQGNFE